MKTHLLVALIALALSTGMPAHASTRWRVQNAACPACGQPNLGNTQLENMYPSAFDEESPFRFQLVFRPFSGDFYYHGWLYSCESCLFSCFMNDLKPIPTNELGRVREGLLKLPRTYLTQNWDVIRTSTKLDLAEATYRLLDKDTEFWCFFYRVQGYWLDCEGNLAAARLARLKALDEVQKLIAMPAHGQRMQEWLTISGSMRYFTGDREGACVDFNAALKRSRTVSNATAVAASAETNHYERLIHELFAMMEANIDVPKVFRITDWFSPSAGRLTVLHCQDGDWDSGFQHRGKELNLSVGSIPNLFYELGRRTDAPVTGPRAIFMPASSQDILERFPVFMNGHADFKLNEEEIENLRTFLLLGRSLVVNCGTPGKGSSFDKAFRREIKRVLPDGQLVPIDSNLQHELHSSIYSFTNFPAGVNGSAEPLETITINGRVVVMYNVNNYEDLMLARLDASGTNILRGVRTDFPDARWEGPLVYAADNKKNSHYQGVDDPQRVLNAYKLYINIIVYLFTR